MPANPSNIAIAERLMVRPEGATMDEILEATGGSFQYNAVRRLEARGYTITTKREGRSKRYFATPPAGRPLEATVSPKGQVTIPKPIREHLHLGGGQVVRFAVDEDDRVVITAEHKGLGDLVGILPKPKRIVSLDEMADAIAKGPTERYRRGDGAKR